MTAQIPPDQRQPAECVADHEHVYRCQDCDEIGRAPAAHADPVRARAHHAVFAAMFEDRNPPGQEWLMPPDWTGWGFDAVADLAVNALVEAGLLIGGSTASERGSS